VFSIHCSDTDGDVMLDGRLWIKLVVDHRRTIDLEAIVTETTPEGSRQYLSYTSAIGCELEMSGNDFFHPIPSHSRWFIPILSSRFSQVLFPFSSHSHWLFPFPYC